MVGFVTFPAGRLLFLEDVIGKGHMTRLTGGGDLLVLVVTLGDKGYQLTRPVSTYSSKGKNRATRFYAAPALLRPWPTTDQIPGEPHHACLQWGPGRASQPPVATISARQGAP